MIVTNETKVPLRVPLGKGRVLHLAPNASAHVLLPATQRPAFQKMVENKEISVRSESEAPGTNAAGRGVGNEEGAQPARIQRKGIR